MFGFYRVATCSPVVKVADTEFNAARILELAEKAAAHSASVVLFPELAVTAYSCGDLFHNETLLNAAEHAVSRIAKKSASLPSVFIVGAPVRRQNRLFNAAVVIQHGRLCGIVPKTNLPNYREFYEKRYFSSFFPEGSRHHRRICCSGSLRRLFCLHRRQHGWFHRWRCSFR